MSKNKEHLVCEMCFQSWDRKISRGRKPRFCPSCIKENVVSFDEVVIVPSKDSRTATRWECPSCGEGITVFISLEYAPICRNPSKHSTRSIEMQKASRNKEAFA